MMNETIEALKKTEKASATAIDLIIRQQAKIEELKAENERLKNAYKQCAWERDVFAKDTREELTKHISICEAEKTEIKAKAYKEFAERLKEKCKVIGAPLITNRIDNLLKELVSKNE